jgi:type II secretory pathway pseudopilin PulG
LLVVIAIIGILSSVVLSSLNIARSKGNDAKRFSDLHQIATALELYRNSNTAYPPHDSATQVNNSLNTVLAPTYIKSVSADPTRTGGEGYRYCTDGQAYTLMTIPQSTGNWCSISLGVDPCGWSAAYAQCK